MRKLMRLSGGTPAFASARAVCASTAHCTAPTALPNSKDTVASRVRYAAPVFADDPVEDRAPFGRAFERTDLVRAHEAAVALHIRCKGCDEASADCT